MIKRVKIISALLLASLLLLSFISCQKSETDPNNSETPDARNYYAKGVPADWADCENTDAKSGTAYFGVIKYNYEDFTSEQLCLYRYEGIRSAVDGAKEKFGEESICLHSQEGPYYDPTATPRPVDSEEHFNYLKALISSLKESDEKGDGADDKAFVLTLEKDGKDVAKYFFNSDGTVEIKRGDKTTYSKVDEETIVFIALLSSIYVPYGTYGSAALQAGSAYDTLTSAEEYQLEVSHGGKTKTYDAEGAVALAKEHLGYGEEPMKFSPVVNIEYNFTGGDFITFLETYKLNGLEHEKLFYLGSDGRVYTMAKNALPDQQVYLSDCPYILIYCGNAYRVNRSRDSFDYAAVKALIENAEA